MKILEWNIRHGGTKSKHGKIIESLVAHDPDTIVLVEYRENENGVMIKSHLKSQGWIYQGVTNPPLNENGIFIASKVAFNIKESEGNLPKAEHRWLDISFPELSCSLLAVHIPGSGDKWDKKDFWMKLCEFGEIKKHENYIIVGDFNTGLEDDYEGTPYKLSEYMRKLIDLGWIDIWRSNNPDTKEFTWYSNIRNGFRLDYAFITPALKDSVLEVYHSHKERVNKYSDHSSLIIEIR